MKQRMLHHYCLTLHYSQQVSILILNDNLGFTLESPQEYADKMDKVIKNSLNLDRFVKPTPFEIDEL